jgi:hypothetical protein
MEWATGRVQWRVVKHSEEVCRRLPHVLSIHLGSSMGGVEWASSEGFVRDPRTCL